MRAVDHAAAVVRLEGFERGVGHRGAQPRLLVVAVDVELLADHLRRREQRAIVCRVGRDKRARVEAPAVQRDQHDHRHQDADEQPAPERTAARRHPAFNR
jgi:hypothetical protein